MQVYRVPVRLNFLGGWSDQSDWKYPGAVVNASCGWDTQVEYLSGISIVNGNYPMLYDGSQWWSVIEGIGTGLGVSSIRYAVEHIAKTVGTDNTWIGAAEEREMQNGTKGGWQDAIGALGAGFKLITSAIASDGSRYFASSICPQNPVIWDQLVLFDTGIRRPAKAIGDKVRALMQADDKALTRTLKHMVNNAIHSHQWDAERFAKTCVEDWKRLCEIVPGMDVPLPSVTGIWGTMLQGAGGGGYGVAFCGDSSEREHVIEQYRTAGLWATAPVLMDGLKEETR